MLGEMGVTSLPKVPKLIQTLDPKEGYVLHFLTSKLYVELGLKIAKLTKVLKFCQGRWMEPFVDLNTRLRLSARNKFEENFYKLIVNSAFGKTMESKLGRKKLEINGNERELPQKTALSTMKSFQIIDQEVATVRFAVTSIFWVKPMIIGASFLDLSKRFLFYCLNRQMKANMSLELLYSDIDSFIYAIKIEDVYADLQKLSNSFDFPTIQTITSYSAMWIRRLDWKISTRRPEKSLKNSSHWKQSSTRGNMQVSIEKALLQVFSISLH